MTEQRPHAPPTRQQHRWTALGWRPSSIGDLRTRSPQPYPESPSLLRIIWRRTWAVVSRRARLIILLLFLAAIALFFGLGVHRRVPDLLKFIQRHSKSSLGIVTFLGAFTALSMVGIPVSVPSLSAGYIFHPISMSIPLVALATAIAGTVGYLCGKYLLRDCIMGMEFTRHRSFRIMHRAIENEGWKIALLVRLSQIFPFLVANSLLAITPLSYWSFISATVVGTLPGLALFVYIGSCLTDITDIDGALSSNPRRYATMVALISSCVIVTLVFITCIARRSWRETVRRTVALETGRARGCYSSCSGPLFGGEYDLLVSEVDGGDDIVSPPSSSSTDSIAVTSGIVTRMDSTAELTQCSLASSSARSNLASGGGVLDSGLFYSASNDLRAGLVNAKVEVSDDTMIPIACDDDELQNLGMEEQFLVIEKVAMISSAVVSLVIIFVGIPLIHHFLPGEE